MNLARLLHGPKSLVLLGSPLGLKSNTMVVTLRFLAPSSASCTFCLISCTPSLVMGLGTDRNKPSLADRSWAQATVGARSPTSAVRAHRHLVSAPVRGPAALAQSVGRE